MSILVIGGAGYIGSHIVKFLLTKNEDVIVVDNLSKGHEKSINVKKFYNIDVRYIYQLDAVFKEHNIETVIHLATESLVQESMGKPYEYYSNNINGMLSLLYVMKNNNVKKIIFSSTSSVYGEPNKVPVREEDDKNPINTYGETMLAVENMLPWFEKSYGIKYVTLRCFNASGAHESGEIGEDHKPETHLIPLLLEIPNHLRKQATIYGDDYDTKDGTYLRDYIHVMDLANGFYKSLLYLREDKPSDVFNLGSGKGSTVKEVIENINKVINMQIPYQIKNKQEGEPSKLIASIEKAKDYLNWEPQISTVDKIIEDAWKWHKAYPKGRKKDSIIKSLFKKLKSDYTNFEA